MRSNLCFRIRADFFRADRRECGRSLRRAPESRPRAGTVQRRRGGEASPSLRFLLLRERKSPGVRSVPPADLRRVEWIDDVEFVARSRVARRVLPAVATDRDGWDMWHSHASRRYRTVENQPLC